MSTDLDSMFSDLLAAQNEARNKLPPVDKWDPPLSGDMDLRIARDGTWYHEGEPVHREGLIRLFSSVLKREDDDYFLVTPVEKWRIQVEDVPFHLGRVKVVERDGVQALVFSSKTGDEVTAGPEHPIRVEVDPETGEPSPYIRVRGNMEGLIGRNAFYELADIAEPAPDSHEAGTKKAVHGVYSLGEFFPLE